MPKSRGFWLHGVAMVLSVSVTTRGFWPAPPQPPGPAANSGNWPGFPGKTGTFRGAAPPRSLRPGVRPQKLPEYHSAELFRLESGKYFYKSCARRRCGLRSGPAPKRPPRWHLSRKQNICRPGLFQRSQLLLQNLRGRVGHPGVIKALPARTRVRPRKIFDGFLQAVKIEANCFKKGEG